MEARSPVSPAQRRLKFQDDIRPEEHSNGRYAVLYHGERRSCAIQSFDHPKTTPSIPKRSVIRRRLKDDESDYRSSEFHGYLGHMDGGETFQDKALNVGVLDWNLLDKWKQNQKGIIETQSYCASYTDSNSNSLKEVPSSASKVNASPYAHAHMRHPSLCSDLSITSTVGFAQGQPNKERIICLLSPPKPISDDQRKLPRTGRKCAVLHPVVGKPKGSSARSVEDNEIHIISREKRPAVVYTTAKVSDMLERSYTSKNLTRSVLYSESRKTLSNRNSIDSPSLPNHSPAPVPKMDNRVEKWPRSSAKLNDKISPEKPEKIIVLVRGDASGPISGEFLVRESQGYSDEDDLVSDHSITSGLLSSEGCSSLNVGPRVSFSYHLPDNFKLTGETASEPKIHPDTIKAFSKAAQVFPYLMVRSSDGTYVQEREPVSEQRELSTVLTPEKPSQVTLDKVALSSRNPSPLRQLSDGFSRMRRSLSLKDNSVVSLPRSSKHFPRTGAVSSTHVDLYSNQASESNRGRSSPLRRLIDPIWKHKLAVTSPYSDQYRRSSIGTKTLDEVPASAANLAQIEKNKTATVHSLLQYSIKNGLPMFKLVSKKKDDALVATLASTCADGKRGLNLNFTLYSVSEMKKNRSWIHHDKTGKHCGYLYNIVGQMKICMLSSDTSTEGSSSDLVPVIESTLFGVQQSKSDQETMKVKASGELAAVVVKAPKGITRNYRENSNNSEEFMKVFGDFFSEDSSKEWLGTIEKASATVIIPDGVHSMPNKGGPSPLLYRWRSGGLCDCGGWDVGCSLNLLHNEKCCCQAIEQCQGCPVSETFQLFSKARAHGNDPSFKLTPFKKGIHSMEFNPSTTSDVQAFFISVTVLSTQAALGRKHKTELLDAK